MADLNNKKKFSWPDFAKKHPIVANLVYICIAGAILLAIGFFFLNRWTHHGEIAQVPNVTHLDYSTAISTLEAQGFLPEVSDSVYDERLKPGTVISSWPRSGAIVKPGREIFLTIASFEPRKVIINMPLVNVSSRQAMKYLESLGIKNVRIINVPSPYPDLVLGAKYNGKEITMQTKLPVTAEVTLEVGNVPTVTVEDVGDEFEPSSSDVIKDSWNEMEDTPQSSVYD